MSQSSGERSCAYCGLPLAGGWYAGRRSPDADHGPLSPRTDDRPLDPVLNRPGVPSSDSPELGPSELGQSEPEYCCLGCRFAATVTAERGEEGQSRWLLVRIGFALFFALNASVFTMVLWTLDVYETESSTATATAPVMYDLFRYLALIFSLPVLILLGGPLVEVTWEQVRRGRLGTETLLCLGVAAAFVYSAISVVRGRGHVYFEVGCVVLVAVTLGKWFEATGKLRTMQALRALEKLLPDKARRWAHNQEQSVPLADLAAGEVVRVLPGERLPVDGKVERGQAAIDQQLVTGESAPVIVEPGDMVYAGTLNLDGDLLIRLTARPQEGALQRLIEAVIQAAEQKGRWQKLADRISVWFTPAVIGLSLGTLVIHGLGGAWEQGLMACLAVLVIACPCALGIATPLAVWAAMGRASRAGVFFRHGEALSRLAEVRAVCFDKTGTLTTGSVEVQEFHSDDATPRSLLLKSAASLASASGHVLAQALVRFAAPAGQPPLPDDPVTLAGRGVSGRIAGVAERAFLGSRRLMDESGMCLAASLDRVWNATKASLAPLCCVGWDGQVRGLFLFRETVRPEAPGTIRWFAEHGYRTAILTGDRSVRGFAGPEFAKVLVRTDLLPDDKLSILREIRAEQGAIAMVGDGMNDAPALAAADVGIAMGCGADLSRETADVCLLGNDLSRLPWALRLAERTVRTVRYNLFWAFSYNIVGIGLAVTGQLNPIWASIAMTISSLLVISNSLRLSDETRDSEAELGRAGSASDASVRHDPPLADSIR